MSAKRRPLRFLALLAGVAAILGVSFYAVGRAPSEFVPGTMVTIPEGASVRDAGTILERSHVIRSESVFQFIVKIFLSGRPVIAGDFAFDAPRDAFHVARMVTGGGFGGTQARITIPEGSSVREIAAIASRAIPGWDAAAFASKAKSKEGYLFPETYIVFKTVTAEELVARLSREYSERTAPLKKEIAASGKTESQIVTMASLLEKEARSASEARVISGILWKRISLGKPLQVDAPFLYVLGKTSAQLTMSDLAKDGPYNTYTRKGLPAGPIGNPGLAMIGAAIHPEPSAYLYYLHDKSGVIHYAKTYDEHLRNKKKYLP